MHIQNTIYLPISRSDLQREQTATYPTLAAERILAGKYDAAFEKYFEAFNVHYWMSSQGLTPSTDSLYSSYRNLFQDSPYLISLQTEYDKHAALSTGKVAPTFSGIHPDGDSLSLEDLRGKIVYIDVWATWCKPCLEEVPSAIQLQERYKGKDVIFLNVSIDRDATAWQEMVEERTDWKGMHILNSGSIMKLYLISGIPKYILIDRDGTIITADAPRPSSSQITAKLDEALKVSTRSDY